MKNKDVKIIDRIISVLDVTKCIGQSEYDKLVDWLIGLKTKCINEWHKQSEKDLFDEYVDWSSTYYAVIMKDLSERVVVSYADESSDGSRNSYFDYVGSDDIVEFDDILFWKEIEKPNTK